MAPSFLVTGATGQQGGATARALLSLGATVHALVRDPTSAASQVLQSLGIKIFKGDMLDPLSIQEAVRGVTGVFLNPFGLPPNPYIEDTQVQQAQNIVTAALNSGTVTTVVVSTVICTPRHEEWLAQDPNYKLSPYYGAKSAVEKLVREAGFKGYTILRPAWLMHNYLDFMPRYNWPELESKHVLAVSYAPSTKLAHLSPVDVGSFAAAALTQPEKFSGHEIELASENLTLAEVATRLSAASGVEITTKFRSDVETAEVEAAQLPGINYQLMMKQLPTVYEVDLGIAAKYGIKLTTFSEYFEGERENKALRKTLGGGVAS